jgi:HK97 family phage major capsid protein
MLVDNKALSLDELSTMVRRAFGAMMDASMRQMGGQMEYSAMCWVMDVYPEYAVICDNMGLCYQVGFTVTPDGVTFVPREQWVKVEKEWVAKNLDPQVFFAGQVKALGDGWVRLPLVTYTNENDPDLTGDFFDTKSDLDIEAGDNLTVYFHHGLDPVLKNKKLGRSPVEEDEYGKWVKTQLNLRDKYEAFIYQRVEEGKMGSSTGPAQHLVHKTFTGKAYHIDNWPIKEVSITPTPAEYRNEAVPLKSIPLIDLKSLIANTPEPKPEATPEAVNPAVSAVNSQAAISISDSTVNIHTVTDTPRIEVKSNSSQEETTMPENTQAAPPVENGDRLSAVEAQLKSFGDNFQKVLDFMQKTPALEGSVITNMGGKQDAQVKSFSDFCLAVARRDDTRLTKVYETKAVQEDQGATGGYYIPPSFSAELVAAQTIVSPIVNMVRSIPVNSPAGSWPTLSYATAPTAGSGNTALAAGLISSTIAEGGSYTDRNIYFDLVNWRVAKHGDIVNVSDEMMADAPQLDGLLRALMTSALASKKERNILAGSGVGEPLGILNAPALVSVTKATASHFTFTDVGAMLSRFKMLSGDPNRVVWIAHPSVIPDILTLQVGTTTSAVTYTTNISNGSIDMPIMQRPLFRSEHLAQLAANGDVILADLGSYVIWNRGQLSISFSEHAAFTSGQVVWRFDERYDGQPWVKSSITLAGPGSAFTQSPFIQHFYA